MKRLLWIGFLVLELTGCAAGNLPDYIVLGDLRILTIIASSPETNPGDSVSFTPVVSDLNGQGRTLNYSVQACIDPGVGVGVTPGCAVPESGSIQTGTVVPSAGTSQTYTSPVSSFTLTMPSS